MAWKSLRYRRTTVFLSIASVTISVVLLLGVERIRNQVHDSFSSTVSETDLIIGSRTSNISLLLASIFHMGYVNQNISYETYKRIAAHDKVAWAIPISLGDSHKGYPVLGTTENYFEHFKYGKNQELLASKGELCIHNTHAVLGATAARDLGYGLGDEIIVTHGMGAESFVEHSDEPFVVQGILKPTGTPVDRAVFVSLFAMGKIHDHFYNPSAHSHDDPLTSAASKQIALEMDQHHDDHNHGHDHDHSDWDGEVPESLTAFMLGMKNSNDILSFQRMINTSNEEPLTAIMPVVTLLELWSVVGPVERSLIIISVLVLIVAFAGMLTTIMTGLNERRREMAILRSVGARPSHIFRLIVLESTSITLAGVLLGIFLLYIVLIVAIPIVNARYGLLIGLDFLSVKEILMLFFIVLGGFIIGLLPAYRSYKSSLADGLMMKL